MGELVRYPGATPTEKNPKNMMKEIRKLVKEDEESSI
jgi:hypothetical protein